MEASDVRAWNFYWQNATSYVKEFGLMNERMARLGLMGTEREIFETMLSAIHDKHLEAQVRNMREDQEAGGKRKPGDLALTGDENV